MDPLTSTREPLVYAVERMGKTAATNVYHACWPSEFPLTICGAIGTELNVRGHARLHRLGSDCETCVAFAAGLPTERENPHR
jgi:hypothetical protein